MQPPKIACTKTGANCEEPDLAIVQRHRANLCTLNYSRGSILHAKQNVLCAQYLILKLDSSGEIGPNLYNVSCKAISNDTVVLS